MKIIGLYLKFSFLLSLILTTSRITAQNLPDGIQYKITGRLLMDGGVYLKNPNNFGNGTEFNDLRIGVKATYQNWGMPTQVIRPLQHCGTHYTPASTEPIFSWKILMQCPI